MATQFLVMVLGWYLVVVSVFLVMRQEELRAVMHEVISNRGLFFVLAFITLILGLMMVVSHNIWMMGWPVLVTLFSWLVLLTGLFRLFYPSMAMSVAKSFLDNPVRMRMTGVLLFVLGLFFLMKAYYPAGY
ncbi:Integral membrane protein (PIN domain superfamily) [Legionella geestiana]|uniref:Integral membrane protein (PIN domain superfamily) n=1 Tax=Legionella geestiana TaxID=45065 RepID=A0A0W0U9L9_9GAMM|nr:hypothetical protein [Legionella geestiana]KTD04680.1 Integral membrane protein (PIN domain superfamily) [Legionella geestiana]QBS11972.1 hypothetical protein E4T54_03965 [Legionella geestiana]QDQ40418.1 hypothetical protein E3226_008475 [Legionella geestiana]STX53314.1 Integral membrane protein (PIN domain superfamily) [Legionella geestiana]